MSIEWKDLFGYKKLYKISSNGLVFSVRRNKELKQVKNKKGYMRVSLINENGERKHYSVHRLVAQTFIPNPKKLETVDHINEDKLNNDISNLQWLSMRDNIRKSKLGKKFTKQHKKNLSKSHKGLPSNNDKFNIENAKKMQKMLQSGIDPVVIGKKFNIGRTSVYNHINRLV